MDRKRFRVGSFFHSEKPSLMLLNSIFSGLSCTVYTLEITLKVIPRKTYQGVKGYSKLKLINSSATHCGRSLDNKKLIAPFP